MQMPLLQNHVLSKEHPLQMRHPTDNQPQVLVKKILGGVDRTFEYPNFKVPMNHDSVPNRSHLKQDKFGLSTQSLAHFDANNDFKQPTNFEVSQDGQKTFHRNGFQKTQTGEMF